MMMKVMRVSDKGHPTKTSIVLKSMVLNFKHMEEALYPSHPSLASDNENNEGNDKSHPNKATIILVRLLLLMMMFVCIFGR